MKLLLDVAGWLGSFLVVVAYALTLVKTGNYGKTSMYLNLVGGIFIAFNCFYYQALPSFVTNIIWSGIAIVSIYRARRQMLKHNSLKNKEQCCT